MTNNKRIAKNTLFLYFRMLVVMAVTFFSSRIILKVLGITDYGIYNVVGGIVSMMSFLNGALGSSTSRFLTYELGQKNEERLKNTFSAALNLHICMAILVLLIGETLGLWFFYEKIVIPAERFNAAFWVFQFSLVTTMISFTQVPYNASLIAHEEMSIYAYVGLYEAISKLLIVYLLYISPIDRLIFYGFLLMLNSISIQLFYRYYTSKKYFECKIRIVKDRNLYKKLLGYSGWDLFGGIAVICQGQGINILLNIFFGPAVNAARAIAVQIQTAVALFINNFITAVRPQVVKNFATGQYDEMYHLTFQTAKFSFLLMLMIVLPLCLDIHFVLNIWLGSQVPEHTATFAVIILLTYLMETFHSASLMSYHAIGRIKTGNIIGGSLMILALPISYIALKYNYPAHTVFIIIFIINFIQMIAGWCLLHHYIQFKWNKLLKGVYSPCLLIGILSLILPLFIKYQMNEGWNRLILLILISICEISILTILIAMNKQERNKIYEFIMLRAK